jgi:neutral ceramidase
MKILAACRSIEITPKRLLDLSGGPFGRAAGLHMPLEAQVLMLVERPVMSGVERPVLSAVEGGKMERFLWIGLDTIYIPDDFAHELKQALCSGMQLRWAQIMISATHTHCAPALMPLRCWGEPDVDYRRALIGQIMKLARECEANLEPHVMLHSARELEGITENRRTPGGPIDPELNAIWLVDRHGRPNAVLAHFTCHPVTMWGYQNLYSPDYPGVLRQSLREKFGGSLPVLFINGAVGNVNPAGFTPPKASPAFAAQLGERLGTAIIESFDHARPLEGEKMESFELRQPATLVPPPPMEELHRQIDECRAALKQSADASTEEIVRIKRQLGWATDLAAAIEAGTLETEVQLCVTFWKWGSLTWLALPGEAYVEIGLEIRRRAPQGITLIAGLTNGCLGYLCTEYWQKRAGAQEKFIGYRLLSLPAETERMLYDLADAGFERLAGLSRAQSRGLTSRSNVKME